jgi:hypothetical protein
VIRTDSDRVASQLHGRVFPGLFSRKEDLLGDDRTRRHQHLWDRAWAILKPTAILCVDGWPTIYFRRVTRSNAATENHWQHQLWNLGHATALVIFDDQHTRIYSGLAMPNPQSSNQDFRRVGDAFTTAAFATELVEWLYSIQTGAFYGDPKHRRSFAKDGRLDEFLLRNLSAARNRLCQTGRPPLSAEKAHALLGRCIFASYLLERGVLDRKFLRRAHFPVSATHLLDLFTRGAASAARSLVTLFERLQDDFNGSLFGDDIEDISQEHLKIVHDFLSGYDFASGQMPLPGLRFYDFSLIPIELISAIYEDFVSGAGQSRRAIGAYYTPPRLAELVVDVATQGLDDNLDELKCLDPACGSGIFLVLLFQRMAQSWRRRHPGIGRDAQAEALRRLLTEKLFGVDQSKHACQVACFSLYLAFLDQFEKPRDIMTLQRMYDARGAEKLLPPLLSSGEVTPTRTIHPVNFFDVKPTELGEFDLVIGNPPWTGRYQDRDPAAQAWIAKNAATVIGNGGLTGSVQKQVFYPQSQVVVPFLWKTPSHLRRDGRGCLLIAAKTLVGNDTSEFQGHWFRRFAADEVWQLSDYRRFLFGGADHPGVVLRYGAVPPRVQDATIKYYTPKVERFDPRETAVAVGPDETKWLPLKDLLVAADRGEAFTVWKRSFWGTSRDQRVLDRLLSLPQLSELAGPPSAGKRWMSGQGFQPHFASTTKPKTPHWAPTDPFLPTGTHWNLAVVKRQTEQMGDRFNEPRRAPAREIFDAPKILVNQGFTKIAFCDFRVFFEHRLQTIVGRREDADLLKLLTAALHSPVGQYVMFHVAANWGIERKEVHLEELLLFPFAMPEQTGRPDDAARILREVASIIDQTAAVLEKDDSGVFDTDPRKAAIERLIPLIYAYYQITPWERELLEETTEIFAPSSTPASPASDVPTLRQPSETMLRNYAGWVRRIAHASASRGQWHVVPEIRLCRGAGVAMLTLHRVDIPSGTEHQADSLPAVAVVEADRRTRHALTRIARAAQRRNGQIGWIRGFTLIEPRQIHIVKPFSVRYWTATAAMNDGDELAVILQEAGRKTE